MDWADGQAPWQPLVAVALGSLAGQGQGQGQACPGLARLRVDGSQACWEFRPAGKNGGKLGPLS